MLRVIDNVSRSKRAARFRCSTARNLLKYADGTSVQLTLEFHSQLFHSLVQPPRRMHHHVRTIIVRRISNVPCFLSSCKVNSRRKSIIDENLNGEIIGTRAVFIIRIFLLVLLLVFFKLIQELVREQIDSPRFVQSCSTCSLFYLPGHNSLYLLTPQFQRSNPRRIYSYLSESCHVHVYTYVDNYARTWRIWKRDWAAMILLPGLGEMFRRVQELSLMLRWWKKSYKIACLRVISSCS